MTLAAPSEGLDGGEQPGSSLGIRLEDDLLRRALASAGMGAFELDPRASTLRLDARCKTLLRITADRTDLSSLFDAIHVDDRERVRQWVTGLAERPVGERDCRYELRCAAPGDEVARRIEISGRLVFDAQGNAGALAGVMRDVTEQRQVDQERDQRLEELARTVRLSEVFVGILAHDLRDALGGITMWAQLASKRSTDETLRGMLGRLGTGGTRIARMVDQLIDFTRARVGAGIPLELGPADLLILAQDTLNAIASAHPEWTIALEGEGATTGNWDAERMSQLMSSLVGNAVQHGLVEHGVRVRVDGSQADEVSVRVHNQGLVPADLLAIIFHPFRAAHPGRHPKGLGLGLYLTRQIALAHGGDVEVTSAEPHGTTFVVRVPRRPEARPSLPGAPNEPPPLGAPATTTTAKLYGAPSLEQRAPRAYWQLFEKYGDLLEQLVQRRAYKEDPDEPLDTSAELRAIAERLGALNAGARDVAALHARALRQRTRDVAQAKSQALIAEGRLTAFELMGHLLSFYRRRAGFTGAGDTIE